jgi:sigma-B regulation protein RsbU (phosphoserine phosphatase)
MATAEFPVTAASIAARPYRVLVCDDQPDVLHALHLLLKGHGYEAVTVDSPRALLRKARSDEFDLILADLNYTRDTTSGEEGLDLLAGLESQGNTTPVIVMTAWGSIDLAVEAMRRGACDFVQKPWDNERVLAAIRKQADSVRRRQSELEIAATVQQKLFPRTARRLRTIDYAGRCVAARGVGGDYYDFLDLGGDEPGGRSMGFVLADVSGKGVPAALLMANLQACFRTQAANGVCRPAELLEAVHKHFYSSTGSDRFATLFFGAYDDRTRRMRYVNCGHCAPLLLRANGELIRLEPTAPMLGAFEEWSCVEEEVSLAPGDTLVLYSDGVTEAANSAGNEFGEHRLACTLRENSGLRGCFAPHDLVGEIVNAVSTFSDATLGDDVTVVAIRGV